MSKAPLGSPPSRQQQQPGGSESLRRVLEAALREANPGGTVADRLERVLDKYDERRRTQEEGVLVRHDFIHFLEQNQAGASLTPEEHAEIWEQLPKDGYGNVAVRDLARHFAEVLDGGGMSSSASSQGTRLGGPPPTKSMPGSGGVIGKSQPFAKTAAPLSGSSAPPPAPRRGGTEEEDMIEQALAVIRRKLHDRRLKLTVAFDRLTRQGMRTLSLEDLEFGLRDQLGLTRNEIAIESLQCLFDKFARRDPGRSMISAEFEDMFSGVDEAFDRYGRKLFKDLAESWRVKRKTLEAAFRELDRNNNQRVDRYEFRRSMIDEDMNLSMQQLDRLWEMVCGGRDFLDFTSFRAAFEPPPQGAAPPAKSFGKTPAPFQSQMMSKSSAPGGIGSASSSRNNNSVAGRAFDAQPGVPGVELNSEQQRMLWQDLEGGLPPQDRDEGKVEFQTLVRTIATVLQRGSLTDPESRGLKGYLPAVGPSHVLYAPLFSFAVCCDKLELKANEKARNEIVGYEFRVRFGGLELSWPPAPSQRYTPLKTDWGMGTLTEFRTHRKLLPAAWRAEFYLDGPIALRDPRTAYRDGVEISVHGFRMGSDEPLLLGSIRLIPQEDFEHGGSGDIRKGTGDKRVEWMDQDPRASASGGRGQPAQLTLTLSLFTKNAKRLQEKAEMMR